MFVIGKHTKGIIESTKDLVLTYLASLGVKVVAILTSTTYALWNVFLPTEFVVTLTRTNLESKDYIFKVEYLGQRRTMVAIWGSLLFHWRNDCGLHDSIWWNSWCLRWRYAWRMEIWPNDRYTFHLIPNWLDLEERRIFLS